jgi:triphosphoribosyl-dephospho-CoA synthetase
VNGARTKSEKCKTEHSAGLNLNSPKIFELRRKVDMANETFQKRIRALIEINREFAEAKVKYTHFGRNLHDRLRFGEGLERRSADCKRALCLGSVRQCICVRNIQSLGLNH